MKTKTFTVHVKRKHILKGSQMDPKRCPVARALRDIKGLEKATTCGASVDINYRLAGYLPQKAKLWIANFDAGKDMKPFSFRVKLKLK